MSRDVEMPILTEKAEKVVSKYLDLMFKQLEKLGDNVEDFTDRGNADSIAECDEDDIPHTGSLNNDTYFRERFLDQINDLIYIKLAKH